jgi:hypothetical protein
MNLELVRQHYENCWNSKSRECLWKSGPINQLPRGFCILVFPPSSRRKMWTYATCGMSQQADAEPIELHLFSPVEEDLHVELLTSVAHYHLTGAYLGVGHTVNFGRPWLPTSNCDHGLVSLPYLDGPALEWLDLGQGRIRFLWLIPVTAAEVEFKKRRGVEELESRMDAAQFNYLDPLRKGLV